LKLESQTTVEGFWSDKKAAGTLMKLIHRLRSELEAWGALESDASDLAELASILEDDRSLLAEVENGIVELEDRLEHKQFELMLNGEHDSADALLTIQAGAGGTESQDWAEMLQRMYIRWAEKRRFGTEILDMSYGEEAGIKSVTLRLSGTNAYGYAAAEAGVHRLVRISPFDAGARRHTSFARVEILPVLEENADVEIDSTEVSIDTFRAGGPGGQHVNKTDSAVRITHIPTGIVATCRSQRSQIKNREVAWTILRARLVEAKREEQEARRAQLKGDLVSADFGNQIRSYVLQPYRQVKDLRTEHETSDTEGVLNGNLDGFIHAYLQSRVVDSAAG
jgi:peptide chain release factor 2